MEAASTSETSVNFYQTTRRCNPEDNHLQTRRRKNLKSYLKLGSLAKEKIYLLAAAKIPHTKKEMSRA
jgi:hypothetical protein